MLKIQLKDHTREAIWVVERIYSIGSAPDNDLVIEDRSISPLHAKLITLDNKLYLKDFGSDSGCYVNNEKISRKQLRPGDTFRLGQVEIKVMDPRESLSQPALTNEQLEAHWTLASNGGWLAGQEFVITKNPSIIGRSGQCDIVISGTHLSRQHAEIRVQGNLLHVRDLASANGTFINNQRVSQGIAKPGDVLRLDTHSFTVIGPNTDPNVTKVRAATTQKRLRPVKPSDLEAKQWKIRPTSPGNRALQDEDVPQPPLLRTLTVVLFLILFAALGFLIYTLV